METGLLTAAIPAEMTTTVHQGENALETDIVPLIEVIGIDDTATTEIDDRTLEKGNDRIEASPKAKVDEMT